MGVDVVVGMGVGVMWKPGVPYGEALPGIGDPGNTGEPCWKALGCGGLIVRAAGARLPAAGMGRVGCGAFG